MITLIVKAAPRCLPLLPSQIVYPCRRSKFVESTAVVEDCGKAVNLNLEGTLHWSVRGLDNPRLEEILGRPGEVQEADTMVVTSAE